MVTHLLFVILGLIILSGNIFSKDLLENKFAILVEDTIPPTIYCLTGIITVHMPLTGCITIRAKDFDRGSFDDVTLQAKLKFYFNGDNTKDSIQICCDDLVVTAGKDQLQIAIEVWVADEAGNTAFCRTILDITDTLKVCPFICPYGATISGGIINPSGCELSALVTLTGPNNYYKEYFTNNFKFSDLIKGTYTLCITKNTNFDDGVTTADIVKIKRHVLGIETLILPLKLLAADVNRTNTLSGTDLSELRRLVLGINSIFQKVPSWIFVPTDRIFEPNKMPDINEFILPCKIIEIKVDSIYTANFYAVKMGDVNQSAKGGK